MHAAVFLVIDGRYSNFVTVLFILILIYIIFIFYLFSLSTQISTINLTVNSQKFSTTKIIFDN